MKKHLFYTFLSVFVATAFITLAGLTQVLHISPGYLTALVSAFLVESAGAVVAIFRKADFFTDDEDKHKASIAHMLEENTKLREQLAEAQSPRTHIENDLQRVTDQNAQLRDDLARITNLRLRILALLGAESLNLDNILRRLELDTPTGRHEAQSVIGELVQHRTIESNLLGYYLLKKD